jgi:hypothetical protein
MTLIVTTALRDVIANALDDDINTSPPGTLEFETAADAEVATITFQNPAFGAAATGVLTMAGQPLTDASATGSGTPVAQFSIYDGVPLKILEGTVQTSGGDINITSLTIAATESVELTTFTITVPGA